MTAEGKIGCNFPGEPVKTFCKSALGEVTSYKYNDSTVNYICELTIYKDLKSLKKPKGVSFFEYIIDSEEMLALKQNGKGVVKKDSLFKGQQAKYFSFHFPQYGGEEGDFNMLYFRTKGLVVKISTFVPSSSKDRITEQFFNSLTLK